MSAAEIEIMSGFDHLKTTYFDECAELLEAAYGHLAAIAANQADGDTVHALFRAFHSIKGGGGAFGFEQLVGFAHELETVLDLVRDARLDLTPQVLALLVRSTDALSDIIAMTKAGDPTRLGAADQLVNSLRDAASSVDGLLPLPKNADHPSFDGAPAPTETADFRVRFVPRPGLFKSANEPLLIIRQLMRIGRTSVQADLSSLPNLGTMDPEQPYIAWSIDVSDCRSRQLIEEAFEFVGEDCELTISSMEEISNRSKTDLDSSTIRRDCIENPASSSDATAPAPAPGSPTPSPASSIRVDVEKVDRLVNLVGELVINQAMLAQVGSRLPQEICTGLLTGLETMSQHLRELQEGVMAIRAQPVKSVFSRMPRLVRDISAQLGKEVALSISGESTEIDKTVIEQLADPLTHLLRNSLDHGIESPEDRVASGKPRSGTIYLSAEHRGGRIVIEVGDNGRGISRSKVLAKARERNLIAPDAQLSDEEIHQLIFLPGFSTADTLSDISGRGVGMDVVKRNILSLGGRISVESREGTGSRFQLSLPLTLAILDGMTVAVGGESYIVPLTNIMESLRPKRDHIHPIVGQGDVLAIRGEYVPLLYLHRRFSVDGAVTDPCEGIVVIVESEGANRLGLVVDELLGQQQVVVKSLEANYGPVDGIGGATVLGDGRVALILDVSRLKVTGSFSKPADYSSVAAVAAASPL